MWELGEKYIHPWKKNINPLSRTPQNGQTRSNNSSAKADNVLRQISISFYSVSKTAFTCPKVTIKALEQGAKYVSVALLLTSNMQLPAGFIRNHHLQYFDCQIPGNDETCEIFYKKLEATFTLTCPRLIFTKKHFHADLFWWCEFPHSRVIFLFSF